MKSPSLPARVRRALLRRLPLPVVGWATRAAAALQDQLDEVRAQPHRVLVETTARALGLSHASRLGSAMDVLQTAIDLADNLADRQADAESGRGYTRHYARIPEPALLCLPALLVGGAVQIVHEAFPEPDYASRMAGQRLLRVLADMAVGQGVPAGSSRRIALVSGKQGLLLCLPFWLLARQDSPWRARLRMVETWAYCFGRTWELRQMQTEQPVAGTSRALARALTETRRTWPGFSPFRTGEVLSPALLGPPCLC